MDSHFRTLSEKYLAGKISDKELDELDLLLDKDPDLKEKLAQLLMQDIEIEDAIKVDQHLKKNTRNSTIKKSSGFIKILLAASVMLACFSAYYYLNKMNTSIGKVSELVGDGTVTRGGQKLKINEGFVIIKGDKIELGERGYLVLKSPNNSLIELDESTNVLFSDKEIDVKKGRMYTEIAKNDKHFLQYACPNKSRLTILGTSFDWLYNKYDDSSVLRVKEGIVKLSRDRNLERVTANQGWLVPSQGKFIPLLEKGDVGHWRKNKQLFQDKEIYLIQLFQDKYFLNSWEYESSGVGSIEWYSGKSKSKTAMYCKNKDGAVFISTPYIQPLGKDLFIESDSYPIEFSGTVEYGYYLLIDKKVLIKRFKTAKKLKNGLIDVAYHSIDYSKADEHPGRNIVINGKTRAIENLFFYTEFLTDLSTKKKKFDINAIKSDPKFQISSQANIIKKLRFVMYAKVLSEKGHIKVPLKYVYATTSAKKLSELKLNTDK